MENATDKLIMSVRDREIDAAKKWERNGWTCRLFMPAIKNGAGEQQTESTATAKEKKEEKKNWKKRNESNNDIINYTTQFCGW